MWQVWSKLCVEGVEWVRSGEYVWYVRMCIMLRFMPVEHDRYGLSCIQVAMK